MNTVFLNLRYVVLLIIVAFAMSFAGTADAQFAGTLTADVDQAVVEFTPPSTRENGSPLPVSEIGFFDAQVRYPDDSVEKFKLLNTENKFAFDLTVSGTYSVIIATYDTDGIGSDPAVVQLSVTDAVEKSAPRKISEQSILIKVVCGSGGCALEKVE